MACNGTYLGECCAPPATCRGQIIDLLARNRFYTEFTQAENPCTVPAFGYRRLKTTTTTNAIWASGGPCGGGSFTAIQIQEQTVNACGAVAVLPVVISGRPECTSGLSALPSEVIVNDRTATVVTVVTRHFQAGAGVSGTTTQRTELLDPFPLAAWIAEIDSGVAFHIANSQGLQTALEWNCNGSGFTLSQGAVGNPSSSGNATHIFSFGTGEATYGIEVRRRYLVVRGVRPYRITRTAARPGCFATTFEDFPKLQPAGIQEVDCVGLNPALNERLALASIT